ncbi:hypothetical protein [Kroppenstedtia guangzhouensis]|nr:hypothetical protein [Kroppenstedtia guangzhouensis]
MKKWSKRILIAIIPILFFISMAAWTISETDSIPAETLASSNPGSG